MDKLELSDIFNLCLVSQKFSNMCNSEAFWDYKLKLDYPDVGWPKKISVPELYKRLHLGYGILSIWTRKTPNEHEITQEEYKDIILPSFDFGNVTYAIDKNDQLLLFDMNIKVELTNLMDKYLGQFFDLYTWSKTIPLATNIKKISSHDSNCFILTTPGTLYQVVKVSPIVHTTSSDQGGDDNETYDLILIDHNVTEINGSDSIVYYIKKEASTGDEPRRGSLYVSDFTDVRNPGDNVPFKLISLNVKFVSINFDSVSICFIRADNKIYKVSEQLVIDEVNLPISDVTQIYDNRDEDMNSIFVIDKHNQLIKIDKINEKQPIVTHLFLHCVKMFRDLHSRVYMYALTTKYELYDLKTNIIIEHNVLSYFCDFRTGNEYFIKFEE